MPGCMSDRPCLAARPGTGSGRQPWAEPLHVEAGVSAMGESGYWGSAASEIQEGPPFLCLRRLGLLPCPPEVKSGGQCGSGWVGASG